MTRRTLLAIIPVVLLIVGGGVLRGCAQEVNQGEKEKLALLIVDETRTFSSSIRVELLARALAQAGLFEISARIAGVESGFENPLQGEPPDRCYDIILIIPRTIEHGTVRQLWVVTKAFSGISAQLHAAVRSLKETANAVFAGVAEAVDVSEDLVPGFFSAVLIQEEWL